MHVDEQPRAVVVGWYTLEVPNWRAKEFPPYQGGRAFDDEIVEQLGVLPEFVSVGAPSDGSRQASELVGGRCASS